MNNINYRNVSNNSMNKNKNEDTVIKYDKVDSLSIKNAFQTMIIQKTMECHELLSANMYITHPLAKMSLAFILLNPWKTWSMCKSIFPQFISLSMYSFRSIKAFIYRKPQPCKKTLEICSITDNAINHLYVAFDWYLKHNSNVKKTENYKVMSMIKPIEASKTNKEYPLLETVPESHETEFNYSNCVFHYSRSSKDDVIYAPSGEVKKKNYMIQIWSYYSSDEMITNLSNHVLCAYAKSKVNEVWTQKLYTHQNNAWKENSTGRNKRKITSVILKHDEHIRINKLLNDFMTSEDWHLERGIPYKKSFLLYGPPGTGKSSMIKAISYETQRHIHYLNLSLIKNDQDFSNLMSKIKLEETVLVMEDIDTQSNVVFERSEHDIVHVNDDNDDNSNNNNKVVAPKLTLSVILNHIDGVYNNHNMILIMTSNYPEKLDKALIRPGRVDERILFDYCDKQIIINMFQNFYRELCPGINEFNNIDISNDISPSSVENAMRKHSTEPLLAIKSIEENKNDVLEEFHF